MNRQVVFEICWIPQVPKLWWVL